ncbi:MAG TPA: type I pantothenate kinase, partial [Porphyromonadaceae bacterium]|nr:type I pantothenate kinase [Porphyromonadaceae bacterium]
MIFKPYEVTYSPFRSFTRKEWSMLEDHPEFPIAGIDLTQLQALNEPLNVEEMEEIYIPLIRLLQIHITH